MSKHYWLLAIAGSGLAVLGLLVWWLVDRENERHTEHEAAYQQYEGSKRELVPGAVIDGNRTTFDPKSYREEWRSERDLEAQREMAQWTFWMVVASGASVVIAGAAVVLVYLTLKDSRLSNEQQLRAYMSLTPGGIGYEQSNRTLIVYATQKNNGQTPAKKVRFSGICRLLPYPLQAGTPAPDPELHPGENVVGPGHEFRVGTSHGKGTYHFEFATHEIEHKRLYFFGYLAYEDIFGNPQKTWACWSFDNVEMLRVVEGILKVGSGIGPHESDAVAFDYTSEHNDVT